MKTIVLPIVSGLSILLLSGCGDTSPKCSSDNVIKTFKQKYDGGGSTLDRLSTTFSLTDVVTISKTDNVTECSAKVATTIEIIKPIDKTYVTKNMFTFLNLIELNDVGDKKIFSSNVDYKVVRTDDGKEIIQLGKDTPNENKIVLAQEK